METSIRDVFLSMQFPPVDEIVATSKTDFRTIRKSRRSCFRSYHLAKNDEIVDTSNEIIDELIEKIQMKNEQLKTHVERENVEIENLICSKREIDLWRQLTNFIVLPSKSKGKKSFVAYDLNEKKTIEFRDDENELLPTKIWNYLGRHLTDEFIETILHESENQQIQTSTGHHAIKKARRTNDATQKIRPSCNKATVSKGKRVTRRSRV